MKIRMTTHWQLMVAFLLALSLASQAKAQSACGECVTIVPGGPVVGQTWTAANSPYCVTGDLFISNLTIEPGVCVLVDGPYRLNIQTTIHAVGTADQPVVFTAKDPDSSKWEGMRFDQTVPGSVLRYCHFSHADDSAIRLVDTAPVIENCTFLDNNARRGADTESFGGALRASLIAVTLHLKDCRFQDNTTNRALEAPCSGQGGAVYVTGGGLVIEGCLFERNVPNGRTSQGHFRNGMGGGVFVRNANTVVVRDTGFMENHARATGGGGGTRTARGGGLLIGAGVGTVQLSNLVFGGNTLTASTEESGGGIYVDSDAGDVTITNVTIARNKRAGLHRAGGNVTVRNSIFWQNNNSGQQIIGDACVDYSIVQNGFAGDCASNNMPFNPAFAGAGTTLCDLTILEFSPAVDAGDPDPKYNDSNECSNPPYGSERNDMGAHGGPGACWTIPSGLTTPDLNGDGNVNVTDLLLMFDGWGPCQCCIDCPADLNGDCVVNVTDLLILFDNWG
jgi:hypothetical protein